MQARFSHCRFIAFALAIAALVLGCATPNGSAPEPSQANDEAQASEQPQPQDDDVAGSSHEMADRLSQAMEQSASLPQSPSWQPGDPDPGWRQRLTETEHDTDTERDTSWVLHPWLWPRPESDPLPPADDADTELESLSQQQLLAELVARIRNNNETDFERALRGAGLSLADLRYNIAPELLAPLSRRQRDSVQQYHQLLMRTQREIARADGQLDRSSVDDWLDGLFDDQPIAIRKLEFCQRVRGYGIYEPFPRRKFLAGQDNKLILYLELDHFQPREQSNGEYEVRLEQEVIVYNDSDGLAVWRQSPVEIVDRSRNRRRDFFVVQMITLPARLSVGQYQLKARIRDLNSNTLDETTADFEIVADESLLHSEAE